MCVCVCVFVHGNTESGQGFMLSAVQRGSLSVYAGGYASYYVIEVIFPIMLLMVRQLARDRLRIRETDRQAGR